MLDYLIQSLFRLLDARDARHWPTVLYVLLMIELMRGSLQTWNPWMKRIRDASESFETACRDLARYYYLVTSGEGILSDRWDETDYTDLVDGCLRAVEHARTLNRLWRETDAGEWHRRGG
ncbi:hypothetical protein BDW62DRAFT_200803 [Aspergillus aurantiobrunneus]